MTTREVANEFGIEPDAWLEFLRTYDAFEPAGPLFARDLDKPEQAGRPVNRGD